MISERSGPEGFDFTVRALELNFDETVPHRLMSSRPLTSIVSSPAVTGDERYLQKAIDRYPPAVASVGHAALKKLRARYPGARVLVFERRGSLPIGLAPADRGDPVFSIVLYPRWVRFFFLEGIAIDDPERRLEGTGNRVRSIRLDAGAAVLDDRYIKGLMAEAVTIAGTNLKAGHGEVVLRTKLKR